MSRFGHGTFVPLDDARPGSMLSGTEGTMRNYWALGAVVVFSGLMTGCAQTVTLRRPADARVVVCGPYSGNVPGTMLLRGCVEDFQRLGYERMPE